MATKQTKLKERFFSEIAPALKKELGVSNVWAVPRMSKVIINVGLGSFIAGKKDYTQVLETLASVSGQKPVVTKARKAISNFKIKEGQPVGVTVTVRGKRMYDFVQKLVNITFPRIRDFRGISPGGFDGKGNYTVGIRENTVFPEVNPDSIEKIHGLEVTIVTTARSDEKGFKLLKALGFPFMAKKEKKEKKENKETT
jgi:large subunit ribosomal protein L5